jgi:heme-degrading monooxygenase HmoA
MYIAMNRFRIALGREEVFEELWRNRDSQLDGVPGFEEFRLLRGPSDEEATLYASHTVWKNQADFEAWTKSEPFRRAHATARAPEGTYLGHPKFEGFEAVLG